jgi:hypothetical protein
MSLNKYIKDFFDELEVYEDKTGNNYKNEIHETINSFLNAKNEKNAYKVYASFFEAYWIGIQDEVNPFLELTQTMQNFEKNSGHLLKNHRDHYIHSVFVFLLGLAIYEKNSSYKEVFNEYALNKDVYPDSYDTKHEEFFYRWGLAALSHDIAYPLEIIVKQASEYIKFVCGYCEPAEEIKGIKVELSTSNEFLELPVLKPKEEFEEKFNKNYEKSKARFLGDSISLLSYVMHKNFNLPYDEVKRNLKDFVNLMNNEGFIDHGFFSAIIMLKWYHHLINKTDWNPSYFYFPVLDASSSVLLHNYYKHGLQEQFNLSQMNVYKHPIAYLLILCDELQEWNRKGYGKMDKNEKIPINFDLLLTESKLHIKYEYFDGEIAKDFIEKKYKSIRDVINIRDLFNKGIIIE